MKREEKLKYEQNIILNYILGGLMWGRFFVPVLALFYIASKVPLEQFAIIFSVFSLSILLLEIPTGVIADLLGKKKTLIISRCMYVIEIAILAFFNGFWPFLIAKIISGVGVSLSSGTSSAFLFDTLKKLGREEEHKKVSGKSAFITNISMAFVFISGAYLFSINPKLPAYISLVPITLGLLLTFFFKEPYLPTKKFTLQNSWSHLKEGIFTFGKNRYLVYLAFYTLIIGSTISMMFSLSSEYLRNVLVPLSIIGTVSFAGSILMAFSSKKAHKLEEKFGEKKSLFIVQLFLLVSVFGMAILIPLYGIIFFLLIPLVSGFYSILISDYVNRHVETSHRATMLSINNMFDNIGEFLIFPVLGFGIKYSGMSISFRYLGLFVFVYLLIIAFIFRKVYASNTNNLKNKSF